MRPGEGIEHKSSFESNAQSTVINQRPLCARRPCLLSRQLIVVALVVATFTTVFISKVSSSFAGSVSYAYDAGGRLICVFDNIAGHGVNYTYDLVGNVTSIATTQGCQQNTMRAKGGASALAKENNNSSAVKRVATEAAVRNSIAAARVISKPALEKASPELGESAIPKKSQSVEKLIAVSR
jgi:hypothetical protein